MNRCVEQVKAVGGQQQEGVRFEKCLRTNMHDDEGDKARSRNSDEGESCASLHWAGYWSGGRWRKGNRGGYCLKDESSDAAVAAGLHQRFCFPSPYNREYQQ